MSLWISPSSGQKLQPLTSCIPVPCWMAAVCPPWVSVCLLSHFFFPLGSRAPAVLLAPASTPLQQRALGFSLALPQSRGWVCYPTHDRLQSFCASVSPPAGWGWRLLAYLTRVTTLTLGLESLPFVMVLLCPLGWEWKIFVFLQYLAFATRNVPMKKRPTTNLRLNLSVTNPMDLFAGNL